MFILLVLKNVLDLRNAFRKCFFLPSPVSFYKLYYISIHRMLRISLADDVTILVGGHYPFSYLSSYFNLKEP